MARARWHRFPRDAVRMIERWRRPMRARFAEMGRAVVPGEYRQPLASDLLPSDFLTRQAFPDPLSPGLFQACRTLPHTDRYQSITTNDVGGRPLCGRRIGRVNRGGG